MVGTQQVYWEINDMQGLNENKGWLNKAISILNKRLNINNLFTKLKMNIAHNYEIKR
jgi:hypothetical protein